MTTNLLNGTRLSIAEFQALQKKFMEVLGISTEPQDGGNLLQSSALDDASKGLLLEASEILNELTIKSKPWKSKHPDELYGDIALELIDVIFYVLEIAIILGLDAHDIEDLYVLKLRKNLTRTVESASSSFSQVEKANLLLEELKGQ